MTLRPDSGACSGCMSSLGMCQSVTVAHLVALLRYFDPSQAFGAAA